MFICNLHNHQRAVARKVFVYVFPLLYIKYIDLVPLEYCFLPLKFLLFPDKRVENWLLMQAYTPTLVITAIYTIFVTWIGPKFMEKREPFRLKWPIVIYNFLCIAVNFHIFKEVSTFFSLV